MLFSLIELSARGSTLKARCFPPPPSHCPLSSPVPLPPLSPPIHASPSLSLSPLLFHPLNLARPVSPVLLPPLFEGKLEYHPALAFAALSFPSPIPARFILIILLPEN